MDKEYLESKKKSLEESFNTLETQKQSFTKQANDAQAEQVRIQGEFRLVEEMLAKVDAPTETAEQPAASAE